MPRRSATGGRKWVIVLGSLVFLTLVVSQALWVVSYLLLGKQSFGGVFLSLGLVGVGLITFFGFIWNGLGADDELAPGEMRTALTASIVIVYLSLVTLFLFSSGNKAALPEATKTLLSSFTSLVAVVVPFYFGASVVSAYMQAKDRQPEAATRRRQPGVDE